MIDKKKKGLLWPSVFAVVSLGFLYVVLLIPDTGPEFSSENANECGNEMTAYVMAQPPVKSLLKAPSTASFPSFSDQRVRVRRTDECTFSIAGYVDAENAFGALVRSPFTASMATDGERWTALSYQISD